MVALGRRPPVSIRDPLIKSVSWALGSCPRGEVFQQCKTLIHCANAPYSPQCPNADELNIEGSKRLFETARKNGIDQIIFLSSLSAQPHIRSHYAKSKLMVEGFLDKDRDVILRLGLVLGPGGIAKKIQTLLSKTRVVPLMDGGCQPVWIIHVEDLCGVVVSLLRKKRYGMLQVGHSQRLSMAELNRSLAKSLRRRVYFFTIPFWLLYPLLKLTEQMSIKLPFTTENILGLRGARCLNLDSDMEKIGFHVRSLDALLESGVIEEWIPKQNYSKLGFLDILRPCEKDLLKYSLRETDWKQFNRFQPLNNGPVVGFLILAGIGLVGVMISPVRAVIRLLKGDG